MRTSRTLEALLVAIGLVGTMLVSHEFGTRSPKLAEVEAELVRVEAEAELFAVQVEAELAEVKAELASIEDAPYLYCLVRLRTDTGNTAKGVAEWLKERGQDTKDWVTDFGSER